MSLGRLVDAVRQHLETALMPDPPAIGAAYPAEAGDLPTVSLSLSDVGQRLVSVGRLPRPTQKGALRIVTELDLADPVARFPDETVQLLSSDRRELQIPHGAIVRSDGTNIRPFAAEDLRVEVGGTVLTVVDAAPSAGQVRPEPDTGELRFGAPLPATGSLELGCFVGQWDVRSERYQGVLAVEAFAADADAVDALTRRLEAALGEDAWGGVAGLRRLAPLQLGPIVPDSDAAGGAGARRRRLTYGFDYELIEPVVLAGGGIIASVAVDSVYGDEHFDVKRREPR